MPRAYSWYECFPFERRCALDCIDRTRRGLTKDLRQLTRFARLQLSCVSGHEDRVVEAALIRGEKAEVRLFVRTLQFDLAQNLYQRAALEAHRLFPGFNRPAFTDGPDVGERRLSFPSNFHDFALMNMCLTFRRLAEEDFELGGTRREDFNLIPRRPRTAPSGPSYDLLVTLDRTRIERSEVDTIVSRLRMGVVPDLDGQCRTIEPNQLLGLRRTLSLPDLVFLHWDLAKPPMSEADFDMYEALKHCDPDALDRALKAGANPNAFDEHNRVPMVAAIIGTYRLSGQKVSRDESGKPRGPECMQRLLDAGAHLDLAAPNEPTALGQAVIDEDGEAGEWLIRKGANDAYCTQENGLDDDLELWDMAEFDAFLGQPGSRQIVEALRRYRTSPDGEPPQGPEETDHDSL